MRMEQVCAETDCTDRTNHNEESECEMSAPGLETEEQDETMRLGLPQLQTPVSDLCTHQQMTNNLQQLINDLNTKRKRDPAILEEFKKALMLHTESVFGTVEQSMYEIYEQNNQVIEGKLQELTEVLGRIEKLELELKQFKHHLSLLYSDVNESSEVLNQ